MRAVPFLIINRQNMLRFYREILFHIYITKKYITNKNTI